MRGVSLWQPWASAIAREKKQWESRSWYTLYRGPLAIHATARSIEQCGLALQWDEYQDRLGVPLRTLPLGAVVAIVDLVDVLPAAVLTVALSPDERFWGDYSDGRYAWRLATILPLANPVPMRGRQGVWMLTEEEERAVREQLTLMWKADTSG